MCNDNSGKLICGSEVAPREIEWLWYPYIPIGKITMLQGDPGEGKSTFALNLAALMTRGEAFPFTCGEAEPMNVIYQNTEDDLDDTVIPRFIRAGGDVSRIYFIDESRNPLTFADTARIEQAIRETDAGLLIFDPLVSYIGEDVAMNQANEVRARFNNLIRIAKEHQCAILIVCHMNKMQGAKALYRAVGSIDVVAAARSCLVIGTSRDDPAKRIMAVQKCNLAEKGEAIEFSLTDGRVEWLGTVDMTADELLNTLAAPSGDHTNKIETAKACLLDLLSAGAVSQQDVMTAMSERDISQRTAENAKRELGIKSTRKNSGWYWSLS